jgi:valyl-tRNA synthetase
MLKTRLYADNEDIKSATLTRALNLFEDVLKIVHPFMPFITEELWQVIKQRAAGESISTAAYPVLNNELIKPSAESEMEMVQGIVYAIRNIRGEMNIPPSKKIDTIIRSSGVKDYQTDYIKKLALVENISVGNNLEKPKASASAVFKNSEIYIPLEGIIDLDVERQRMDKELKRLEGLLTGLDRKLTNEQFIHNAPKDVVEKERAKKRNWSENISKLKEILSNIN